MSWETYLVFELGYFEKPVYIQNRMSDRFKNFALLKESMIEGKDFKIVCCSRADAKIAVVAPHGGKIEPGTSELANLIAGDDFAYYSFEGRRPKNNGELHITSHNFDEPKALELVKSVGTVLGIHGMRDGSANVDVCIGGLDKVLRTYLDEELTNAGFKCLKDGPKFPARKSKNICNRGSSGAGAQLELSRSFRQTLFLENHEVKLAKFVEAVRKALFNRLVIRRPNIALSQSQKY